MRINQKGVFLFSIKCSDTYNLPRGVNMLYERHIPELKSGQTVKIKRTVNNDATKKFILNMFKRRAYYRLKDYKNVVIKTNNKL